MGILRLLKKIIPTKWMYESTLKKQHAAMLNHMTLEQWDMLGRPIPPPALYKQNVIIDYAKKYNASHFIETGTFMGDTSWIMKDYFERVDTCELDTNLAARAIERFKHESNVYVWQGNSGVKIGEILENIDSQKICLFWLDGHFSGGVTAKADLNTPILAEIMHIFKHAKHHVILIDDARLFLEKKWIILQL